MKHQLEHFKPQCQPMLIIWWSVHKFDIEYKLFIINKLDNGIYTFNGYGYK